MPHIYLDDTYYFITSQTRLGERLFNTDEKKQIIKNQIIKAQKKFNIKLFAYSVVSNHYHLLLHLKKAKDLGKIIQLLNGGSSRILNLQESVNRSIWGSYWDRIVKDESSFYRILGYTIGNPYKHGLVKKLDDLAEYSFCSYKDTVLKYGRDFADDLINQSINIDLEEAWQFEKIFK